MSLTIASPWRRTGLILAATLLLAACSSSGASSAPTTAPAASAPAPAASASVAAPSPAGGGSTGDAVAIKDFSFGPVELTVKVGAKVTWTNQGNAAHTVTFDSGGVDSGSLQAGATFDHTFDTAGSFAYHCNFHSSMKGVVVVGP